MKTLNTDNRYLRDQHDDGKSGYRLACRPVAMVEAQVLEVIRRNGGQPLHLLVGHLLRAGVPERETMHALLRLVALDALAYDLSLDLVVAAIPPRLSLWRRLMNKFNGGIHPALVLIACVGATASYCLAFLAR